MRPSSLFTILLSLATTPVMAQSALWLRHNAISPDGSTIAFSYQGDIYTVPVTGGRATQLTTNAAYDSYPVWSPDGSQIAFASDRMGSLDLFIVSRDGGKPQRLTTHSNSEIPVAFLDTDHVLYEAVYMPTTQSLVFPGNSFKQIYSVETRPDARPVRYCSYPMESLSLRADGALLFQDKKGYEDTWRKHHTSPITRDIWMMKEGKFTQLTTFEGEDRNPVWAADGTSFYYLSEQDGTSNVYLRTLGSSPTDQQLTHFTQNPVRFLTISNNGTLCFSQNGELYTLIPGQEPKLVEVDVFADTNEKELIKQVQSHGARQMAVSKDGKEVAFVMRGDVYVTSVEHNTTRRITNTPWQERDVDFAPDGRSVVYASERYGLWQIYQSSIVKKEEKSMVYATEVEEKQLTRNGVTSFTPKFSPDGKEVAFLRNRTAICVINLKSNDERTVMSEQYQYSYSDGDQWFEWSPDSRWILADYIAIGGWNNKDVALLDVSKTDEIVNLTQSGYNDTGAKWVMGGKAIIWESDRAGYRSHGSWGAESDVYAMFFDAEAYEKCRQSDEDIALLDAMKSDKEKKKEEKEEKKDSIAEEKGKVEPLKFDLEHRRDRILRLTVNSTSLGNYYLTPKCDKLYYLARYEGGMDLWCHNFKEHSTTLLKKGLGNGAIEPGGDDGSFFLCTGGTIQKVTNGTSKPVSFKADYEYRPAELRSGIFEHTWQQVKDKFYVADLQGTDWQYYHDNYSRFLPYITNNYDYAEMMSEMLGELNASHTGMRYYPAGASMATAQLGIFFDESYQGDGLKIEEIIAGSPLTLMQSDVKKGDVIEQIDGIAIRAGQDYFPLLEGKAGRTVRLTIRPAHGKCQEVMLKPITFAQQQTLLYKRWVERNRQMVDRLSGGKVGYVHIEAMNGASFHTLYEEVLGINRDKEALIVDTRHNGGGWLHDDVVTLLNGKVYQRFMPRGQYIGSDPFNKWCKPSCMLICEDNYSNAHGTPWVYKTLGVGPLIGTPIAGTMTAVWWENQVMDSSLTFGIPQVGCMGNDGEYQENHTLQPDILIYNTPEQFLSGEDAQIQRAVEAMLKK